MLIKALTNIRVKGQHLGKGETCETDRRTALYLIAGRYAEEATAPEPVEPKRTAKRRAPKIEPPETETPAED